MTVTLSAQYLDLDSARAMVQPCVVCPDGASNAVLLDFAAFDSATPPSCVTSCTTLLWGPAHRRQDVEELDTKPLRTMQKGASWSGSPGVCFLDVAASEGTMSNASTLSFTSVGEQIRTEYSVRIESEAPFGYSVASGKRYPFIMGGYRRAPSTTAECIVSIFRLHNETINIWTHIVGTVIFLCLLVNLLATGSAAPFSDRPVEGVDTMVIGVYLFSAIVCFFLSSLYHMLTSATERIAHIAEKADLCGILVLMMGSNFPMYVVCTYVSMHACVGGMSAYESMYISISIQQNATLKLKLVAAFRIYYGFFNKPEFILMHTGMSIFAIVLALAGV